MGYYNDLTLTPPDPDQAWWDYLDGITSAPVDQMSSGAFAADEWAGWAADRDARAVGLARRAFWGSLPALMHHLEDVDGYEMNGTWYPSNGMTLARAIELARAIPAQTWAELVALGSIPA